MAGQPVNADLEQAFMPSRWSRRMDSGAVVAAHVAAVTEASIAAKQNVANSCAHRYGPAERETLDLFGVDLPAHAPIVMYVSGGYWQDMSGSISSYPAPALHANGIVSAIVDYDRAPGVTITEIVEEVVNAAKWVLEYAKSQRSRRIVLAGHSAGAHLCAMVVCSAWFSALPDEDRRLFGAVVHLSGVFDLKPLLATSVNGPLQMTVDEAEANSPLSEHNARTIVHNSADLKTVFYVAQDEAPGIIKQCKDFAEALKNNGVYCTHETVPMVDHFTLVEKLFMERYAVTKAIIALANE